MPPQMAFQKVILQNMRPRAPQQRPRAPQERPRWPQERLKRPQERPKSSKRVSKKTFPRHVGNDKFFFWPLCSFLGSRIRSQLRPRTPRRPSDALQVLPKTPRDRPRSPSKFDQPGLEGFSKAGAGRQSPQSGTFVFVYEFTSTAYANEFTYTK